MFVDDIFVDVDIAIPINIAVGRNASMPLLLLLSLKGNRREGRKEGKGEMRSPPELRRECAGLVCLFCCRPLQSPSRLGWNTIPLNSESQQIGETRTEN